MDNIQQEFFDYFYGEHNITTLESDFMEIDLILQKQYNKLIEKAFVAGRSQTSWEQFKKDNDLK
jgi:hypothetical protein